MPPDAHRVRVLTLAREEIRALPRQSFALGAAAVILALLAPFAALVLEGPDALREYLFFLWVVAQLVVAVVLAGRIASARRTRFVDSLYTTPLEMRTWLAAQLLVGAFLASLVLLAQLPIILVHVVLLGVPTFLLQVLLASLAVAAVSIALGAFCGVVVGGAGPGAAAGMAGGIGFVSFILLLFHTISGAGGYSSTQLLLLHLSALSPLTLAINATGIDLFGTVPTAPWRAMLGLAALVVGLGAAAWITYTRAQAPLGWERGGRMRMPIVALVALAVVIPVATASTEFQEIDEDPDYMFSHGEYTRIAFVQRGTPITDDAFTMYSHWEWKELVHQEDNELDMLVMLTIPEGESVRSVRIQLTGGDDVRLVSGGQRTVPDGAPDGRARVGTTPYESEEATGPLRPVYRVPVVLHPEEAHALRESPILVKIDTSFVMDGRPHESHARVTLQSDMPGALSALLLAGAPAPLAALGAFVTRRIHTR